MRRVQCCIVLQTWQWCSSKVTENVRISSKYTKMLTSLITLLASVYKMASILLIITPSKLVERGFPGRRSITQSYQWCDGREMALSSWSFFGDCDNSFEYKRDQVSFQWLHEQEAQLMGVMAALSWPEQVSADADRQDSGLILSCWVRLVSKDSTKNKNNSKLSRSELPDCNIRQDKLSLIGPPTNISACTARQGRCSFTRKVAIKMISETAVKAFLSFHSIPLGRCTGSVEKRAKSNLEMEGELQMEGWWDFFSQFLSQSLHSKILSVKKDKAVYRSKSESHLSSNNTQ